MEFEEEKTGNACGFSGKKTPVVSTGEKAAEYSFYEKLSKLHESSGLSLIFNFRETIFDLHLFYKEVITRGGFHQVTRAGKWAEVKSALNLKAFPCVSPAQLHKLYEILLLQFEQMYCKMPEKANKCSDKSSLNVTDVRSFGAIPSCLTEKTKHCGSSSSTIIDVDDPDSPAAKRKKSGDIYHVAAGYKIMNQNSTAMTALLSSNEKKFRNVTDTGAPMKPRSGYQIFLKLECHRLKLIHGESSGSKNIRDMAIHAWRCLPDKYKKPYIEAGKMDKERYDREMAYYNWRGNNENPKNQCLFSDSTPKMLSFSTSSETDNDYHVSLQSEHDNIVLPDESMVELAFEAMKNAESSDAMFQIDWDDNYLDRPN